MTPRLASHIAVPALVAVLAACSGSSGGTATPPARVLVTTTTNTIEPARAAPPAVDLAALGVRRIDAYYRVTTPADAPFAFDLVAWPQDATQPCWLMARHVRDGDRVPPTDGTSLAAAGILAIGQGVWSDGTRTGVYGDGIARLQLTGILRESQLLAITTSDTEGASAALVEIAIGAASAINRAPTTEPDAPGVLSRRTIYSSPSWQFGLPTVAVSGDRTTVVCYEGDRRAGNSGGIYELRMQPEPASNVTVGGATLLSRGDPGNWRDHEVAGRFNLLAVARCEVDGVRVRVSYDRGVTFGQDVQVLSGDVRSRLVQIAMGRDYALAIAAWRTRTDGSGADFVLIEGQSMGLDQYMAPTWYQFGAPQVLHTEPRAVTPLTTGIAWSDGGDLVIGYAANWFEPGEASGWASITAFRCAVRLWGGTIVDREIDRERIFGMDPSVAVSGSGSTMRIAYAYESATGLELAISEDAGATFAPSQPFGRPGDHLPTVFLRPGTSQPRIDVLYIAMREGGAELHQATWREGAARTDAALTRATLRFDMLYHPPTHPMPPPLLGAVLSTQLGWLGYDAVLDGNEIVVAYDEVTANAAINAQLMGAWSPSSTTSFPHTGQFLPAIPPPLAPGLTEQLPAVDASQPHQLKLLRLQ